jgi:type IV pilus assembly protein PilM
MPKSVVGLDIGRGSVRAVEVENPDKARPTVVRVHEVALPNGAVVSGEVSEIETVATAIRTLWSEGGFTSKDVVIGMGNQRVIARDHSVPKMATLQQIREALPFQVQDLIPVPVNEALLDFYPISEFAGDRGPMINGLLIAAVKESVMANVTAVKRAGLRAMGVDLIAFALSRALVRGVLKDSTVAVVDIGSSTTQIVVTSHGIPHFVRMIPAGGEDITRAIMSRLEIGHVDAEAAKFARGLSSVQPTSETEQATAEAIGASAHQLLTSIRNTFYYYTTTHPTAPLDEIILTGNGSLLPGMSPVLSEFAQLQVEQADAFSGVEVAKSVAKGDRLNIQSMTVALGLALGAAA